MEWINGVVHFSHDFSTCIETVTCVSSGMVDWNTLRKPPTFCKQVDKLSHARICLCNSKPRW